MWSDNLPARTTTNSLRPILPLTFWKDGHIRLQWKAPPYCSTTPARCSDRANASQIEGPPLLSDQLESVKQLPMIPSPITVHRLRIMCIVPNKWGSTQTERTHVPNAPTVRTQSSSTSRCHTLSGTWCTAKKDNKCSFLRTETLRHMIITI